MLTEPTVQDLADALTKVGAAITAAYAPLSALLPPLRLHPSWREALRQPGPLGFWYPPEVR